MLLMVFVLIVLVGCNKKDVYLTVQSVELKEEDYELDFSYDTNKKYSNYYIDVTYTDGTSDYMDITWKPESSEGWFATITRTDDPKKQGKLKIEGRMEKGEITAMARKSVLYYVSPKEYERIVDKAIKDGYLEVQNKEAMLRHDKLDVKKGFKNIES